jgi:predicted dehydrogenase
MTKADGEVLLIGPGLMGREYAKVLLALKIPFRTIGRSERSCSEFEKATGAKAESIGLEALPREEITQFSQAIVATDTELMAAHAVLLMQCGVRKILLEKPGGVDQQDIQHVNRIAAETKSDVVIAYNRRFYAAVLELKNRIVEDGGLKSVFFDFTEWPFKIEALPYPEKVKQNWILRNSSHVIDLVFYLAGSPREFNSFSGGELK